MRLYRFYIENLTRIRKTLSAFADDFVEDKWFKSTVYEYIKEQRKEIEQLLCE